MAEVNAAFEAEVAEIQSMFPGADREVIVTLLRDNNGQVNEVIDLFLQDSGLTGASEETPAANIAASTATSVSSGATEPVQGDDAAALVNQTLADEELARQLQAEEDAALAAAIERRESREQRAREGQQQAEEEEGPGAMAEIQEHLSELGKGAADAFNSFAKFVKDGVQSATAAFENLSLDDKSKTTATSEPAPEGSASAKAAGTTTRETRVPVHRYASLPGDHEEGDHHELETTLANSIGSSQQQPTQ